MTPFKFWILAARPRTLPAAAAPVLAATGLAAHAGSLQPVAAAVCLLFALSVQILANFANDYYDFVKGADTEDRMGPARAVASGWIAPQAMRRGIVATAAFSFAWGLLLLAYGDWWFLLIGLLCLVFAIGYTGGPFPLAYLGLGDLFVMIFFGWIATGLTYYVQAGHFQVPLLAGPFGLETVWIWLTGTVVGGLAVLLLAINNYRDYETDMAAGKNTLAVRFGRGFVLAECRLFLALALLYPPLLAWVLLSWKPLLLWLLAWPAVRIAFGLPKAQTRAEYGSLLASAGFLLAGYGLLLAVVTAWA